MTHNYHLKYPTPTVTMTVTIDGEGISSATGRSFTVKLIHLTDSEANHTYVRSAINTAVTHAKGIQSKPSVSVQTIGNLDPDTYHSSNPQANIMWAEHLYKEWFRLYVIPGTLRSTHPLLNSDHHQHYGTSMTYKF